MKRAHVCWSVRYLTMEEDTPPKSRHVLADPPAVNKRWKECISGTDPIFPLTIKYWYQSSKCVRWCLISIHMTSESTSFDSYNCFLFPPVASVSVCQRPESCIIRDICPNINATSNFMTHLKTSVMQKKKKRRGFRHKIDKHWISSISKRTPWMLAFVNGYNL